MKPCSLILTGILTFMPFTPVFAGDDVINTGDTAWIIIATALVMMMTPAGLALFYGGMSRYKNLLNTIAMTFVAYCLGSVVWMTWGYTLAFGPDKAGFIGGLDHLLLNGITINSVTGILSPRYLLYVNTKDILEHISLFGRLKDSELVWEVKKDTTSSTRIISVCAKDKPGLFSKIAGVLTLSNIDILDAQIYTWKNNIALDIFHVAPPKDQIFEKEVWERTVEKVRTTLRHNVNLSIRLKQKIQETKPEKLHTLKRSHQVYVDNKSSDFFTIVEVCTYDFHGLLFSITDTLYKIGLDVYVAKIATKVDQVVDIFYVRNLYGEKVDTKAQVEEIKNAIRTVLPVIGESTFQIAS